MWRLACLCISLPCQVRIERSAPVWCLQWSPPNADKVDVMAVGCWDQTLSFYLLSGAQQNKDRILNYDPCSLSYYVDGEYIVMGGSDRKVSTEDTTPAMVWFLAERAFACATHLLTALVCVCSPSYCGSVFAFRSPCTRRTVCF